MSSSPVIALNSNAAGTERSIFFFKPTDQNDYANAVSFSTGGLNIADLDSSYLTQLDVIFSRTQLTSTSSSSYGPIMPDDQLLIVDGQGMAPAVFFIGDLAASGEVTVAGTTFYLQHYPDGNINGIDRMRFVSRSSPGGAATAAPIAAYEALLDALRYNNRSDAPAGTYPSGIKVFDVTVSDGSTTSAVASFKVGITGENAPTVSAASPTFALVEAGGVSNTSAGTASSSITLTKSDALGIASYDEAYLTSNGWSTNDSGSTYTKTGSYGAASFLLSTGVITYTLDNKATATQSLTANQRVTENFGYIQVSDGTSSTSEFYSSFTALVGEIKFSIDGSLDKFSLPTFISDSGASSSDRITKSNKVTFSGLAPNTNYEFSVDSGKTWTNVTSPLNQSPALKFDGINDFVSIPNNTSLPSGNNPYTLEAWIKPDQTGDRGIIGWGPWGQGNSVNALRLMGSNMIRHYWWGNDLDVNVGNLADGKWHHVAATFDGRTRKVYVDGVLKGSDTPSRHSVPVSATNVRIGSTNNGEYFAGSIDDASIWSKALNDKEILQRQSTRAESNSPELILRYAFDESSGVNAVAEGTAGVNLVGTLISGPERIVRDVKDDQKLGTVDVDIKLADGVYNDNQILLRSVTTNRLPGEIIAAVPGLTIDTDIPIVKLNSIGGSDFKLNSNELTITGSAAPGANINLYSNTGSVKSGNLKITSDNGADVFLNGVLVGKTDNWTIPYDFTGLPVKAGRNVLAVLAYDVGGIAGLSGRFEVPSGSFGTSNVSGWKVKNIDPESDTDNSAASRDRSKWNLPSNWNTTDFDDSSWQLPVDVREKTGQYPWGNRANDPTWIWSSDPYNHDAVLFRYSFDGTNSNDGQELLQSDILVDNNGQFSYTLTPLQVAKLGQGNGKTLTASYEDIAGNFGSFDADKFSIDTIIGPVKVTSIGGGDGKVTEELVESGKGPLKFKLDQYTNYWSSKLSDLQNYVKNFTPTNSSKLYSKIVDVVDFTDDKAGFAGELPYDLPWPAAEATNYFRTDGINNNFFAKISTTFDVSLAGKYRFRTFNDDGVFLLIDNKLVINDPTLHPEVVFTGDIELAAGNHDLQLFFFENGGEASLEFSVSQYDSAANRWSAYKLLGMDDSIKAQSVLKADNLIEGTSDPNCRIDLYLGAQLFIGTTQSDISGNFKFELTKNNLLDIAASKENLIAKATDSAGNSISSQPALIQVMDNTPQIKINSFNNKVPVVSRASNKELIANGSTNLPSNIYVNNLLVDTVNSDQTGKINYIFKPESLLKIGQGSGKKLQIEQVTASGIKGKSEFFEFSVDTIAPEIFIDAVGNENKYLSSKRNLIIGRAEANQPLSIHLDSKLVGNALADKDGSFSYTFSDENLKLIENKKAIGASLSLKQTDSAGNETNSIPQIIYSKLSMTKFSNLSVGGQDLTISTELGDNILRGMAESNLLIDVFYGNILLGNALTNQNGDFSYTITTENLKTLGQGTGLQLKLQQDDVYGNTSQILSTSFSVDTVAPLISLPIQNDLNSLGGIDSTVSTKSGDSTLYANSEAGASASIIFNNKTLNISPIPIGKDGILSYKLNDSNINDIGQGINKELFVEIKDPAGNKSIKKISFNVDTTPPPAPSIQVVGTDGIVSSSPTYKQVFGLAQPNSGVLIKAKNLPLASVKSNAKGEFSYVFTSQDLSNMGEGRSYLIAEISDIAGNVAQSQSFDFTVDTVSPLSPNLIAIGGADSTISTQVNDNLLNGKAEPNSLVSFYSNKGMLGTVSANSIGDFSYRLTEPNIVTIAQGSGKSIKAISTDRAGNSSTFSSDLIFNIDTLRPSIPIMSSMGGSDGVITSILNDNIILGKCEPGSTLKLIASSGTNNLFELPLVVSGTGNWKHELSSEQLDLLSTAVQPQISIQSSDIAGNTNTYKAPVSIDIVAPKLFVDSIGGVDNTVSSVSGDVKIMGKAEANLIINFKSGNTELGNVRADSNGLFTYNLTSSNIQSIGQGLGKSVILSQSDNFGNKSTIKSPQFDVDTISPVKPVIANIGGTDKIVTTHSSDRTIYGNAESGTTLDFYSISGATMNLLGSQKTDGMGQFSYILSTSNLKDIGQGVGKSIVVVSSDLAGNSITSSPFAFNVQALWRTGTTSSDSLEFHSGIDALTGLAGSDTFKLTSLGNALINNTNTTVPIFDHITDFQMGIDKIDAPISIASRNIVDRGTLSTLSTSSISKLLTETQFAASTASVFHFKDQNLGMRSFLALNNNIAGFNFLTDAVVEITGFSGLVSNLTIF